VKRKKKKVKPTVAEKEAPDTLKGLSPTWLEFYRLVREEVKKTS